ncbi:hypothetical protein CPT03_17985 [Pedobacter ginsengisoli]|uniref:Zinc-finger domain-containing protein n=1 Tax=Pedobacter ginsengisoli TaxID=363852 RepID=A0A2D1U9G1_9SPHI|nr:hypothetical protein [Pedobacter ginsengisoli]ATP58221.1 hypothetical protein CPT03_17985 [Pedobacter ginsengisoli]
MNQLKKIQYNCRKATYLIEKQQIGRITTREKLELKIHLAGCSICKTFQRQSILINHMVRNLFQSSSQTDLKLDEDFKKDLQKRIDQKLGNN